MSSGFIYVLINPSIPGLAKVGKTSRNPSNRVAELSSATGVPSPFLLVYQQPVSNCDAAETWVHVQLEGLGYRHASNREFFNAPLHEIVAIVARADAVCAAGRLGTHTEDPWTNPSLSECTAEELFSLANQYATGTADLLRDDRTALALFEQAAAQGHELACVMAATRYRVGSGVRADPHKALTYYRDAVRYGAWFAEAFIAALFMDSGQRSEAESHWNCFFDSASKEAIRALAESSGEGQSLNETIFEFGVEYCVAAATGKISDCLPARVPQDVWRSIEKAIERRISEPNDTPLGSALHASLFGNSELGDLRAALCFVEDKLENCIDVNLFLQMAEAGNAVAQAGVAAMYELGRGVEQDDAEAVEWLRQSAGQGNLDAQRNLAGKYYQGCGVEQNYEEAAKWFMKGAEQGDLSCQFNVANLFLLGHGVMASESESFKWFLKAAVGGHVNAQFTAGAMYENGQGVDVDDEAAAKWYALAAQHEHPQAQFQLGQMYEQGRGVDQDYRVARELYRKAASSNNINAQYCLGRMYENGTGIARDILEARRWYETAAENGQPSAVDALAELEAV